MIYLDNAATTQPLFAALQAAEKFNEESFFNPSALYRGGLRVREEVEKARDLLLSRFPSGYDAIFTSCGSEGDNTAVFSFAKRGNAVTTAGEHPAIRESFKALSARGVEPRFAKLNANGSVNEESLLSLVDDKTTFVSVVHVNNETGAINDIDRLAANVKKKNPSVVFHSDGVQAFGKLPYTPTSRVDAYTVSAHKIGGLKGTGALVFKKKLNFTPMIWGGGQESGRRSGTENVFGIVVFREAMKTRFGSIREDYARIAETKRKFIERLNRDNVRVLSGENSSAYLVSLSAEGLRGEVIQHMMEDHDIVIGTGSACSSRHRHSRILTECGYSPAVLDGALRISFCADTKEDDALFAADKLNECVAKLKGIMKK